MGSCSSMFGKTLTLSLLLAYTVFGEGAQLAEILSADDQNTVNEVMLEAEATITEDPELTYWFTGLTDMNDDHVWDWEHSGPIQAGGYTNWNSRAVPNVPSFNCMQLLAASGEGKGTWMTFLCGDDYINTHPLCQLPRAKK